MTYIIIVLCLLLILLIYRIYIDSTVYEVNEVNYTSNKIKKEKVKIAFLSDLHNRQYGEKNSKLYSEIESYNPDFIVFAGDMVSSHGTNDSKGYKDTLDFIEKLNNKWPVYYGIGNHEEKLRRKENEFPGMYDDITERLSKIGAPILCDEIVTLEDYGIKIYGFDLEHKYFRRFVRRNIEDGYLEDKLGKADENYLSILLAHNPEHFDAYEKWKPDLVLSGHLHGGIVRLPFLGGVISPSLILFPKYDAGIFKKNNTEMIVNRGIGSHTIPLRLNNKAEIIFINITGK